MVAIKSKVSTVIHYLQTNQHLWAWWTVAFLLPACLIQFLSFKWFWIDGHKQCCSLVVIHVLQLGIMKRYWDSLLAAVKGGDRVASNSGEQLMKLGDLSVLRLLEALLQTLPHLLLQAYIYLALEETDLFPGVSAGLSLLSLSWALVSYSRFMCLLKPGHLYMPWAALLCQMLWRMGMLGTRVMALAVFARVHHFWTFAVAGLHWLVMSFWLASQQTDIINKACYWKVFNILVGAVYIFCYINLRDGTSRCRVVMFYSVMLLENLILLLLATDFLQEALWSSVWMTLVVMAGFVIGVAALIIYYSLLHPKSTQIYQNFKSKLCQPQTWKETADTSFFQPKRKNETSEGGIETLDETHITHSDAGAADPNIDGHTTWFEMYGGHHHWLLLKLALKTGNLQKIYAAFGDGGIDDLFPCEWLTSNAGAPVPVAATGRRYLAGNMDDSFKKRDLWGTSDYITIESVHEGTNYIKALPTVNEEHNSCIKAAEVCVSGPRSHSDIQKEDGFQGIATAPTDGSSSSGEEMVGLYTKGMETCNNSTLYFSADMEGALPSGVTRDTYQKVNNGALRLANESALGALPESEEIQEALFPVSGISPIVCGASHSNFRRSAALDLSSQCDVSTDASELMEKEGVVGVQYSHLKVLGSLAASVQSRIKQEEEPCFTSTPKPEQVVKKFGTCDMKARKKLIELEELKAAK
ncbi:XK-related protein 5 isoform X2 [Lissotriton helveticus]